jgi:hypothetical protein
MAIRLRQTTQKDTQASAASFGLGLDYGDGGTRAIQGALGQVAGAAKQIAGNLERKDAATQQGNGKRKGTKMQATWDDMVREGETLIANKEFGLLDDHKKMMKAWSENAHVNDVQFSTDGDTSVRDEYANPINEHFRNDYGRVEHAFNMASLTGAMVHEAEVTFERSGTILERDVASNTISSKTGEDITDHLGIYFDSGAFAESTNRAQEVYTAHATGQMGAYVDAMRFKQARNPNIEDAKQQLKDASEQVREATWMGVDAQNGMLDTLSVQFKAIESGQSVYRTLNDFGQASNEASSSGYADRDMDTITQQYRAAKSVVKPGSSEDKNLDSSYTAYAVQSAMNGSEQRQWMVDNPDGKISDLPGIDKDVLDKIDDGDMNKVLGSRDAIVKAYNDAESSHGKFAAKKTLYPHAAGVFHSFDTSMRVMQAKLAAGESLSHDDSARLRREARKMKQITGEYDPRFGPNGTVSGDTMIAGSEVALEMLKDSPEQLGNVVTLLTAANDGNFDISQWAAVTSDSDSMDMKVMKRGIQTSLYVAPNDIMYSVVARSLAPVRPTLGGDALKAYDAVYAEMDKLNDGRSVLTGSLQAHARQYGTEEEAMFFANLENATIAESVENNPSWSPESHISNARKLIRSVAQTYTGSDGRSVLLYANTRGKIGDDGVRVHSGTLSAFMAGLFEPEGEETGEVSYVSGGGRLAPQRIVYTDRHDRNITREEATDMMYHWAGEYVKENYDSIVDQYVGGLKKHGPAEYEEALKEFREDYPVEKLLKNFNLSTEMMDPDGVRVVGLTTFQAGPGGFAGGQSIVKMDSSRGAMGQFPDRGVFIPVDEIIKKLQDPKAAALYREQIKEIDQRVFDFEVIQPLKAAGEGAARKVAPHVTEAAKRSFISPLGIF